MLFRFGETVTFEALSDNVTTDAHGNPVETYETPVDVPGCAFDPGGSVEQFTPGRDAVITSPRLLVPTGTVVLSRDRVTVRGLRYEVNGDPANFVNPFTGWGPALVVPLERVAG